MPILDSQTSLKQLRSQIRSSRRAIKSSLMVCGGTGCRALSCQALIAALAKQIDTQSPDGSIRLRVTDCHGFCQQGPVVTVDPGHVFYCRVKPGDAAEIVAAAAGGQVVERLLYVEPTSGRRIIKLEDIPFYQGQDRQILSQNLLVDPRLVDDYIAAGGYSALSHALQHMSPADIIRQISASGLRGRGGGGFPTGRKWAECSNAPGNEKYVVCNADEGDPGAFMDRSVLEGNPHLVMEGMIIGALAVGANKGYIYVRNEYPEAVKHARLAISQARELGLLGMNILGSKFSFDIEVARGGGAFVCGESTALMASLEGKVGEPRAKDVHTAVDGLWHRPTVLNNVETWANVPSIVLNGADWFSAKGTSGSKGTKILALTGQIKNTGLVEVPMGTSIRSIVFGMGGGPSNGKAIKAVQTGGPSGGCLPVDQFDLPIDFDSLTAAHSMMGSGGMVVMDESTCMVDVARYFLNFLQDESCGKCLPCRTGIDRMLEIITGITEGHGRMDQLDLLEELGETIALTSLCGLGKSAPNPVLSTLRYFRAEYEAHIRDRRCPAGVCKPLITYSIDAVNCNGCGVCLKSCSYKAISGHKKALHTIDAALCRKCGICRDDCKFDAVLVV